MFPLKPETFTKVAKFAVAAGFNPAGVPQKVAELAIDQVAGWLSGQPRSWYEQLVQRVTGDLARLAETRAAGEDAWAAAVGNAELLFQRHGLGAAELARLGFDPGRADAKLRRRGKDLLRQLARIIHETRSVVG